jgi:hypothetical protein
MFGGCVLDRLAGKSAHGPRTSNELIRARRARGCGVMVEYFVRIEHAS